MKYNCPKRRARHLGRVHALHRAGRCYCQSPQEKGDGLDESIEKRTAMNPEDAADLQAFLRLSDEGDEVIAASVAEMFPR